MDKRVKVGLLDPKERINNFDEVEKVLTKKQARKEAGRCLHCKNAKCIEGCPIRIMIPEFIKAVKKDNLKKAYQIIKESSSMPAICGRVCPQEKQCEKFCIKNKKGCPIAIGTLERFVADNAFKENLDSVKKTKKLDKKVAIIGSGPAGISCAYELAKAGIKVVIYEILHKAGGVLTYGIPEFRLPKKIVEREIENLLKLGVEIRKDMPIGRSLTIRELEKEYDAIFIATGAGIPKFMNIIGEDANGVFAANEILARINLMKSFDENSKTPIKKGKEAYVIGAGNVAMDVSRCLKRLGIKTHVMYRRTKDEMPARKNEIEHALEEGIIFDLLQTPKRILTNSLNEVIGMEVVDMQLTNMDSSGRYQVIEKKGSIHHVSCDMIVLALGNDTNTEAFKNEKLSLTENNLIITKNTKTSKKNIYAGGDVVDGSSTVIKAMAAGREAANEIIKSFS